MQCCSRRRLVCTPHQRLSGRRDEGLCTPQGVAALLAMNILAEVEGLEEQPWGCADHLHCAIEAMRLAFGDALQVGVLMQANDC